MSEVRANTDILFMLLNMLKNDLKAKVSKQLKNNNNN